jgi:hypothetical protein
MLKKKKNERKGEKNGKIPSQHKEVRFGGGGWKVGKRKIFC